MARRINRRGFTLIEIAVVVALIGILAGMAYPSIASAMTKADSRNAQSTVAAYLARARATAVQHGRPARLILTGNVISVAVDSAGTYLPVGGSVDLRAGYGASAASTRDVVEFDARGMAVGLAAPVEFTITLDAAVRRVCVRRLGTIVRKGCLE